MTVKKYSSLGELSCYPQIKGEYSPSVGLVGHELEGFICSEPNGKTIRDINGDVAVIKHFNDIASVHIIDGSVKVFVGGIKDCELIEPTYATKDISLRCL